MSKKSLKVDLASLNPLSTLLLILSCYRLANLLSVDQLTEPLRIKAGIQAAGKDQHSFWFWLAEWINCPYCTGVWFALVLSIMMVTGKGKFLILLLGIAGGQDFLQSMARK